MLLFERQKVKNQVSRSFAAHCTIKVVGKTYGRVLHTGESKKLICTKNGEVKKMHIKTIIRTPIVQSDDANWW